MTSEEPQNLYKSFCNSNIFHHICGGDFKSTRTLYAMARPPKGRRESSAVLETETGRKIKGILF